MYRPLPKELTIKTSPIEGLGLYANEDIKKIRIELERYDEKLSNKERWLLLNKSDLLSDEAIEELKLFFQDKLGDKVKIFIISALTKDGCQELIYKINDWIMKRKESD